MHHEEWQDGAACRGLGVTIFFSGEEADTRAAVRVCAHCEVRTACFDAAVARSESFGVWGGTTESERRRILRRRSSEQRRDASSAA